MSPEDRAAQLRATIAVLQEVIADRGMLDVLTVEERTTLLAAAGDVFHPDADARRHRIKQLRRTEKAQKSERAQAALAVTGIRELRQRPVFHSPNVFAPVGPAQLAPGPVDESADLADGAARHVADGAARHVAEERADVADGAAHHVADGAPRHVADGAARHVADGAARRVADGAARDVADDLHCYICKQPFRELHHFYDQLCGPCAVLNFAKRAETADLRGRTALVTGGRVKIGYQAALKLVRAGADLIVTTRFPRDAAARLAQEPDFADWSSRVEVFGLDLRHTPSVEAFCAHLSATRDGLDYIVNNACQTVRRPPEFYRHMMELETAAAMPAGAEALLGELHGRRDVDLIRTSGDLVPLPAVPGVVHSALLSQVRLLDDDGEHGDDLFPHGRLDADLQQVDLRDRNSWRLMLDEVSSVELLETQLVNAVAPFVLNARLKHLLVRAPGRDQHIVNVSAVEGQFYRRFKTTRHPHTNMAKAALNMMTRTSAADYQAEGIHMNSVDTGWVTDEDPAELAARKTAEHRFHPPLDIIDGAARIVDPIIDGVNTGHHVWGRFLKDYRPTDW